MASVEQDDFVREVIDLLKWVGLGERMDALPPILSPDPALYSLLRRWKPIKVEQGEAGLV